MTAQSASSNNTSKPQEEDIDNSLNELLKELNQELESTSRPPQTPFSSTNQQPSTRKEHYTLSSFPTEMSCAQAFEQMVSCYSLGGQIRHMYRYGSISYCEGRWAKLRFCLQTKAVWDPELKSKKIAQYYMQKLAEKRKVMGSSEDVWEVRKVPVKDPFNNDLYKIAREEEASKNAS